MTKRLQKKYKKRFDSVLRLNGDYVVTADTTPANTMPTILHINGGSPGFLSTIKASNYENAIKQFKFNLESIGMNHDPENTVRSCIDMFIHVDENASAYTIKNIFFPKENRAIQITS